MNTKIFVQVFLMFCLLAWLIDKLNLYNLVYAVPILFLIVPVAIVTWTIITKNWDNMFNGK